MITYSDTGDERRENKRYEGVCAAYALTEKYDEGSDTNFKTSFLRNFSLDGASLFISEKVPDRSYINVHLYDAHWKKPIVAFGGIVWSSQYVLGKHGSKDRYNIGIRFFNVPKESEGRLKLMIMNFELEQNKPHSVTELTHHHNQPH